MSVTTPQAVLLAPVPSAAEITPVAAAPLAVPEEVLSSPPVEKPVFERKVRCWRGRARGRP